MNKALRSKILILSVVIICILIVLLLLKSFALPSASGKPSVLRGDINKDGNVNTDDAEFIRKASPCNHANPCWNMVVGKTRDGDNPIYVSDLDINHDDNVNELDVSAMSSE